MDLFEIVNGSAVPSVHALMIKPFKDIWESDTSDFKENSIKIFTYIELLCSPKKSNPFVGCSEEDRPTKVKKEVWGDEDYPIGLDVMMATLKYKELLSESSPSYELWVSAVNAVKKLRVFLDEFDMDERNTHGMLILKPKDVTNALKDLEEVSRNMELGRERVHSELVSATKTRNEREIGYFER